MLHPKKYRSCRLKPLGAEISQWIQYYRIGVKLLFAAERKLCDQIFEGKHAMKDHCFAQLTEKGLSILLSFGDAIAKSQASPVKLFVLLDMYEATLELQPDQHATQYRRISWGKALEFLSVKGLTSSLSSTIENTQGSVPAIGSNSSITSKSVIKERFGSFNMQFEKVCQTQINWIVPDRELRVGPKELEK